MDETPRCLAGCTELAIEPPLCPKHYRALGNDRARQLKALYAHHTHSDNAARNYWRGLDQALRIVAGEQIVHGVQAVLPGMDAYGAVPYTVVGVEK